MRATESWALLVALALVVVAITIAVVTREDLDVPGEGFAPPSWVSTAAGR